MNINEEVVKQVNKVIEDQLPNIIEEKVTSMMQSVVRDIFGWSGIEKEIKNKIQEAIDVNLMKFDVIDYNALIAKTINDNLVQQVNLQPLLDMTSNIVGFINKKTITLQEVANMFIEASMEENNTEGEGEITFIVRKDDSYGWVEVFADLEPDTLDYKCAFKFILSTKRDGKIFSFRIKDAYEDSAKPITPSKMVNMSNLEAKIFRLYSAQVSITDYDEPIDNYWCKY